jgi:23S rRNA-/tRNA-specific pseudouridylate synthase
MPHGKARPRRWVVDGAAPLTLTKVLSSMQVDGRALVEGRVFLDRRRADDGTALVHPGTTIDVFPAAEGSLPEVEILERRHDLIAVSKPAGLSTIPDQRGTHASLQGEVARLLDERDPRRLHATSRLDHDVSGVVLFALGSMARDRAHRARESGRYRRHYVAIAGNAPDPLEGRAEEPIGRAANPRQRRVGGRDAKPCSTSYATIAVVPRAALVVAEPATGRTHQIRVHLAHRGAALLGDRVYAAHGTIVTTASGAVLPMPRIALHAAWVRLVVDDTQPPWTIRCPVPAELLTLWRRLGGAAADWETALLPLPTMPA